MDQMQTIFIIIQILFLNQLLKFIFPSHVQNQDVLHNPFDIFKINYKNKIVLIKLFSNRANQIIKI